MSIKMYKCRDTLTPKIKDWGISRGIITNGKAMSQAIKTLGEDK